MNSHHLDRRSFLVVSAGIAAAFAAPAVTVPGHDDPVGQTASVVYGRVGRQGISSGTRSRPAQATSF